MHNNAMLVEQAKIVTALAPIVPSSSTPDRVSMKGAERCTVILTAANGATVTGSAITLKQSQDVGGTGEKAIAFTKAYRNVDTGASDTLAEFSVSSDTFTTDTTNAKNLMYVMEVKAEDLDLDNGFDVVRVGTGNAVNSTVSAVYVLWPLRHGGLSSPSAIVD
jgi:hypothetical protein